MAGFSDCRDLTSKPMTVTIWVVVKSMVPFWIPIIIRHLIFRVPNKGTIVLRTLTVSTTEIGDSNNIDSFWGL